MSVAMICSNCRHWFAPRGSVAVGKCRRFPATVSTHGQDMCGEWSQGEAKGRMESTPPSGIVMDTSKLREGLAKATEAVQSVKKGGRR